MNIILVRATRIRIGARYLYEDARGAASSALSPTRVGAK